MGPFTEKLDTQALSKQQALNSPAQLSSEQWEEGAVPSSGGRTPGRGSVADVEEEGMAPGVRKKQKDHQWASAWRRELIGCLSWRDSHGASPFDEFEGWSDPAFMTYVFQI